MTNYKPISCDYYDELTWLATQRKICPIAYENDAGGILIVDAMIMDIFTRNKEEFILLSNHQEIRLDRLISVDGKARPANC